MKEENKRKAAENIRRLLKNDIGEVRITITYQESEKE